MDKCRVVIYDCYVPLNEDARLLHLAKIQEMENAGTVMPITVETYRGMRL